MEIEYFRYWFQELVFTGVTMTFSIHGHISYILEASSKGSNDLSLIGRKPK